MRKIKRIAKFEGLEPRRCEDIKGIVVPDIGPKSFGTFEKQGAGRVCLANYFKITFFVTFRSVNFKSKLPSPNFSACCLIPMNSMKCLQAVSIELCFSISNGARPLCRSNAILHHRDKS